MCSTASATAASSRCAVEAGQDVFGVKGERIGNHQELGLRGCAHVHRSLPCRAFGIDRRQLTAFDMHRRQLDTGKNSRADRNGCLLLDLSPRSNHATRTAPEEQRVTPALLQETPQARLFGAEIAGQEHADEVRNT